MVGSEMKNRLPSDRIQLESVLSHIATVQPLAQGDAVAIIHQAKYGYPQSRKYFIHKKLFNHKSLKVHKKSFVI